MHANTTDEFWIDASADAVYESLLAPGVGWWPGARATTDSQRVRISAPGFHRLARRVRFEARLDKLRPGQGMTWWLDRGELHGRGEWWLERFNNGTIVHYFLDVDPGEAGRYRRWSSRVRRHRWAVRRGVNALKRILEGRD